MNIKLGRGFSLPERAFQLIWQYNIFMCNCIRCYLKLLFYASIAEAVIQSALLLQAQAVGFNCTFTIRFSRDTKTQELSGKCRNLDKDLTKQNTFL